MLVGDALAGWPGLEPQPHPDTPEGEQMIRELAFALAPVAPEPEAIGRAIVTFMIRRRYWPLGTIVTVDDDLTPHARFPWSQLATVTRGAHAGPSPSSM